MANLSQRLDLKLGQSLVMTPQLQQAIKMLQMSNQELTDYVLTEIEQNPLLDRADPETGMADTDGYDDVRERDTDGHLDTSGASGDNPRDSEQIDSAEHTSSETYSSGALDTDYDNVWSGGDAAGGDYGGGANSGDYSSGGNHTGEDDGNWLEATIGEAVSLRDKLVEQIQLDIDQPQSRLIALMLLEQLDEAGYCKADLPALAAQLGVDEGRILAVLKQLQSFDPPGIFARNLSECLALQLYDKGLLTDEMEVLIENLPLLAEKSFGQLEKLCSVSRDELGQMMQAIKQCNPKPGFGLEGNYAPATVIPEIIVKKTGIGTWLVELNQDTLPKVLINERYFTKIKEGTTSKKELDYLQDRYNSANWLVKALHQRATTILKVATAIVAAQENFFNFGLDFLKPMTLKDVAGVIQMHESTVSRVTTSKYMATPKGVFELKFFFSTALGGADGGVAHAATSVKNRIKTLIEAEDPKKVLSDDQIVSILKKDEGIDIARRTVAKYREAMNIGSSTERRRMKSGGN